MDVQHRGDAVIEWWVLVPVKGGGAAKSRLVPPPGTDRRALSRAFALDTIAAVAGALPLGRVLVVTGSAWLVRCLEGWGVETLPDPRAGLNPAVRAGLRHLDLLAARAGPTRRRGVAVLLGDLPALRDNDIRDALRAAEAYPRAVVPDRHDTGTVLLTALAPLTPVPAFGPRSAARHTDLGHHRLALDAPRLRTDVDDSADLTHALALGVGPRTQAALGGRRD